MPGDHQRCWARTKAGAGRQTPQTEPLHRVRYVALLSAPSPRRRCRHHFGASWNSPTIPGSERRLRHTDWWWSLQSSVRPRTLSGAVRLRSRFAITGKAGSSGVPVAAPWVACDQTRDRQRRNLEKFPRPEMSASCCNRRRYDEGDLSCSMSRARNLRSGGSADPALPSSGRPDAATAFKSAAHHYLSNHFFRCDGDNCWRVCPRPLPQLE